MEMLNYNGNTYQFTEEQVDELLEKGLLEYCEGNILPNPNLEISRINLTQEQEQQIQEQWDLLEWVEKPVYKDQTLDPDAKFDDIAGALTASVQVGTKQVKDFANKEFKDFRTFRKYRKEQLTQALKDRQQQKGVEVWLTHMEPYRVTDAIKLPRGFQKKDNLKKEIEQMTGKSLHGVVAFDGEEIAYISSDGQQQLFADCSEDLATKLM